MPVKLLKEFLDANHVRYLTIAHSRAFTSQEVAASAHIPGKDLAKSVVVKLDGKFALTVLTASEKIDFDLLKRAANATTAQLASEREFRDLFPECEMGAMPPFGNLYAMPVYVSETLTKDKEIAFNAGTHTELIKLAYADFERLANPKIVQIAAFAMATKAS